MLKEACTSFNEPPYQWKLLYGSFLALKMLCHNFTRPPQWSKLLFWSLWTLNLEWTSFTGRPQLRKMHPTSFLTPKLVCTSLAGIPQWWKNAFYILPVTKQACMSFSRSSTYSTVVKTAFSVELEKQTGMHELCRTSIVVKIIFYAFLSAKLACTNFTGPPYSGEDCFQGLSLHSKCCGTTS